MRRSAAAKTNRLSSSSVTMPLIRNPSRARAVVSAERGLRVKTVFDDGATLQSIG